MTALRREAIQLVEQMPEEQMPYVIQYINMLKDKFFGGEQVLKEASVTPKMKAFFELEKMIVPVLPELDYDKELEEARNEKYGCSKFSSKSSNTAEIFRNYGTH